MEINFKNKSFLFLGYWLVGSFFVFKSLSAATITGSELKTIIEDWLQTKGKEANVAILEDLKYPECEPPKI